jgi:Skp family chaperone for outer membrane proteins
MTKNILFAFVITLLGMTSFSQKGQRIAYVDMNYILENIPAYASAQDQLDKKVIAWQQNLDKIQHEIETMKTDLSNEKTLLTNDLIAERNEDIELKEEEFKKLEEKYFSSDGILFLMRKQLVTPIQDQVYNATQDIAKTRRYDFVFDKSSDLIMLYSSKQNDISELVLKSIERGEKASKAAVNKASRSRTSAVTNSDGPEVSEDPLEDDANEIKISDRDAKRQEALAKIAQQKIDRAKKWEAQKKAIQNKASRSRTSKVSTDSIVAASNESPSSNSDGIEVPEDLIENDAKEIKINKRDAKRQEAQARIEQQKLDRIKKREDQKKAIEKKRLERLKQREKAPNEVEDNKENDTDSKKENVTEENEND